MAIIMISYDEVDNMIKSLSNDYPVLKNISVEKNKGKIKLINLFDISFDGMIGNLIKSILIKKANANLNKRLNMRISDITFREKVFIEIEI